MASRVAAFLLGLLDGLLPPVCHACGDILSVESGTPLRLCPACSAATFLVESADCSNCGDPLSAHSIASLCPECTGLGPPFRVARAVFIYEGTIPSLVLRLKHGGGTDLAAPMGTLMAALAHRAGLAGSHLIVPVPSLPRRHLERGYNPAALLATHVGRCLGVPVRFGALKRVRDTASRDRLDRKTRFARVREAYRAGKALDIQGRSILLVDDVLTTGATAEACSRVLMEAGAAAVDVLVFAGAIPRGRPNPLSDQP